MANQNLVDDGLILLGSVKIGGVDMGYTSGGFDINITEDRQKFYVDQQRSALKERRNEMEYEVILRLAQVCPATLQYALGQAAANVSGDYYLTLDDVEPSATTLEFIQEMTDAPNIIYYFHNAQFTSGGGMQLRKGEPVTLQVTFKCFKDTATSTKHGYIYQIA